MGLGLTTESHDLEYGSSDQKAKKSFNSMMPGAVRRAWQPTLSVPLRASRVAHTPRHQMRMQMYDRFLESNLDKLLSKTGTIVQGSIKDPYMPQPVLTAIDRAHQEVWDDVEEEMKEMLMAVLGVGDKESKIYNANRLKHWKQQPPAFWPANRSLPNPYNWFRARMLYALQPADGTIWKNLRDPVALGIMLLKSTPTYGINVWTFCVLFFLIDKRDEFQLVHFILKFKGFQFLSSGLIAMTFASAKMFRCAADMRHINQVLASAGDGNEPQWVHDACATGAPGTHKTFWIEVMVEPVRILLIWTAFVLLKTGFARGGKNEIRALEKVRIDAADGSLDGTRDFKKLQKSSMSQASHDIDDDELLEATEQAREEFGAEVKTGGYLPVFLLWDVFAFFTAVGVMSWYILWQGYTPEMWMFWSSIYYMKALYACLAFPFLVFIIPGGKMILTHAKPTGYDMSGHLCPKLTNAQIRRKFRLENKPLPSEKFMTKLNVLHVDVGDVHLNKAAAKIQAQFKGRQVRGTMLSLSGKNLLGRLASPGRSPRTK